MTATTPKTKTATTPEPEASAPADARQFRRPFRLRSGVTATIRAIEPDDRHRVRKAFEGLAPETVYLRFHGPKRVLTDADLDRVVAIDHHDTVSLVVTVPAGDDEQIIGGAQYVRLPGVPVRAEVAFTIEEDFQGNGLATHLLRDLAAIARQNGVCAFEAYVLHDNRAMLRVFERSGLPMTTRVDGDSVLVSLDLQASPAGGA
jgi:RimJ/RimL family protein N-acetyltransferase